MLISSLIGRTRYFAAACPELVEGQAKAGLKQKTFTMTKNHIEKFYHYICLPFGVPAHSL
jgi:hypothetical protein